jgi:CRISPR-associated protein Csb2
MSYLCFTIRLLQPYYHGRGDGAEPEWPPSPLRLFQAILAAASRRWGVEPSNANVHAALQWLEDSPYPRIVAPTAKLAASTYRLYVPDNVADKVAKAWSAYRDASISEYRTEKDVRPMHVNGEAVHYLFPLNDGTCPDLPTLTTAARSITHLGWGVDMIAADACILSEKDAVSLNGEQWHPVDGTAAVALRCAVPGTLAALTSRHQAFLSRIRRDEKGDETFNPVPPLTAFDLVGYRREGDVSTRGSVIFELRKDQGDFFSYPQRCLIHIAGMVRHLAIANMQMAPPDGVAENWVETYVAGHSQAGSDMHRQFSYLPLPSIGHRHVDPSVRRVMIAAPPGDDRLLHHLATLLAGQQLKPTEETQLECPPTLVRVRNDRVARYYVEPANVWCSVTPVILPGHNDHKPMKTRKLIEKALLQSGIVHPCDFDWSPHSRFPKALSAHKYDRQGRPTGYIRPSHLLSQTAVHLVLRFKDGLKVPGPLAIGAGRHCGFGLMARSPDDE